MKQFAKSVVFAFVTRTWLVPIWKKLYLLSLAGMGVGTGSRVSNSGEARFLKRLAKQFQGKKQVIIFDIGANIGQFAESCLAALGEGNADLHCFEPSPTTFKKLNERHGAKKGVHLNNLGLGDQEGSFTLYSDCEGSEIASLYQRDLETKGAELHRQETVKVRRLDDYCQENAISHIDFLKMDVEGHEMAVFKGAEKMLSTGAVDWIQFEFGGANIDSRTFFRDFFRLLQKNYCVYRILHDGLLPIREADELNEVFVTTNYVARRSDVPELKF